MTRLVDSIRPLISGLKHIFWNRLTIKYPNQRLELPQSERGRHFIKLELCIGCGRCEQICPTLAIRLKSLEKRYSERNKQNRYPSCDFGRCCFCDLCIETCPTHAFEHTDFYELSKLTKQPLKLTPIDFANKPEEKGWRKKHKRKAMQISRRGAYHV
ncbi:MAG: 4Fe-4S binding protein [Promethearchaeota archaeon]